MLAGRPALAGEPVDVHAVENRTIFSSKSDIPVRIYHPSAATAPLPVLVYFHGGGWVIGDIDTHDDVCRSLCRQSESVVVSVDYRLAPEHKFPAAVDDCIAATQWVVDNANELGIDTNRLAVGGDSAGGSLSAIVTQWARDNNGPDIKFQLLIYPATDMTMSYPSIKTYSEGYRLTQAAMDWFIDHYMRNEEDKRDVKASPLFADDFTNLPKALIMTAGFDPLVDEGKAYADKLQAAGVAVEYICYDGMIHGFFAMAGVLRVAREAQTHASQALKAALSA